MRSWLPACAVLAGALLSGCASPPPIIRSQVTTFHEWPATLPSKNYVFERTKEQDNNLEYRSYENLVRNELNRLGFTETPPGGTPALKANFDYGISVRDVRVVYPVASDPYWSSPWPYWRRYRGPFYDPFWYGPPVVEQREANFELYTRRFHVTLADMPGGRKLYDTTVVSEGQNPSLAYVMPYLVRSAFAEFPGPSGVPRVIELQGENLPGP
ncbi:DUF4136 domain-containing protein [Oxalobacteraceae bacterium OM1]|nr:DUF4136 domain-containing protein [Oxalobacteraceae bacterium OM1]